MADSPGLILEASFDQGVPTWKVQRHNGKNTLPDLVSSGTADSFETAKAAANSPGAPSTPPVKLGRADGWLARWPVSLKLPGEDRAN